MKRWAALALGLTVVAPAQAHRGHDSLAVVTLADGSVTVSHRFEAHDIEPALAKIAPGASGPPGPAAFRSSIRSVKACWWSAGATG